MTYSYVCHDWCVCVTWLINICDMTQVLRRARVSVALLHHVFYQVNFMCLRLLCLCLCLSVNVNVRRPIDASYGRSFTEKEPLIVGLFCGKSPIQIWHPIGLRPLVLCIYFNSHCPEARTLCCAWYDTCTGVLTHWWCMKDPINVWKMVFMSERSYLWVKGLVYIYMLVCPDSLMHQTSYLCVKDVTYECKILFTYIYMYVCPDSLMYETSYLRVKHLIYELKILFIFTFSCVLTQGCMKHLIYV